MEEHRFRAPEDSFEYEEFFNAASGGDVERLEAALLPSLDVNALEADRLQGRAALHMAAQTGSVQAIQFLLTHGAKVDLRNSEYETPLHEAAFYAHPEAVKALLDAGSNIHLKTGDYSYTALHNVLKHKNTITSQQIETIELLLDRGSDVNAEADSWGSTLVSLHLGC
jgi:ankyrin repeat protein